MAWSKSAHVLRLKELGLSIASPGDIDGATCTGTLKQKDARQHNAQESLAGCRSPPTRRLALPSLHALPEQAEDRGAA